MIVGARQRPDTGPSAPTAAAPPAAPISPRRVNVRLLVTLVAAPSPPAGGRSLLRVTPTLEPTVRLHPPADPANATHRVFEGTVGPTARPSHNSRRSLSKSRLQRQAQATRSSDRRGLGRTANRPTSLPPPRESGTPANGWMDGHTTAAHFALKHPNVLPEPRSALARANADDTPAANDPDKRRRPARTRLLPPGESGRPHHRAGC